LKSGIWHMFCTADRGKLVLFLESAGQIYPKTGLTFEAPKCVLASIIAVLCVIHNIELSLPLDGGNMLVIKRYLKFIVRPNNNNNIGFNPVRLYTTPVIGPFEKASIHLAVYRS